MRLKGKVRASLQGVVPCMSLDRVHGGPLGQNRSQQTSREGVAAGCIELLELELVEVNTVNGLQKASRLVGGRSQS